MKKLVQVTEIEGEGLESLMGESVLLMCGSYFYAGKLTGVNEKFVQLENPQIVYETGPWTDKTWKHSESLSSPWYVTTSSIESYGRGR